LFFPQGLEPFIGTETFVDFAFLNQPLRIITIEGQTLRLAIGTISGMAFRAFLPGDAQPSKVFQNAIHGGVRRSFHVGIFNPEDERSLMAPCKNIIEEGGSSVSDMKEPGRSGSKADTDI